MKHFVLLTILLAFSTLSVRAQTHQRSRSPFLHSSAAPHASNGARGDAPMNDDCSTAEVVTVSADCTSPIPGNNAEATDIALDVPCDDPGSELLDVWYTFNSGSATSTFITLTPSAEMTDFAFVVYDACGGNPVWCVTVPTSVQEVPVSVNMAYWVRVYSNLSYGTGGAFTLCISSDAIVDPAPPNDLCPAAVPQTVPLGGTATFSGDNTGATDGEGLGFNSAWEAFTITSCADVKLDFCGTAPNIMDFWLLLYSDCPASNGIFASSYDTTTCSDGNFTLCFPDLAPGTYYYGLAATNNNTGPYTMSVSAEACSPDEVLNDDCIAAIPLPANTTCIAQSFTNACATQSLPAVTCGGFTGDASDDVWYSFVATATEMTVGGDPHGNMDIVLELFQGPCSTLTSIGCADVNGAGVSDDLVASTLTVGNTYFLRVYDFRPQYAYGIPGFDLCVVEGQGSGVGVSELNSDHNASIFPNPSSGAFTITVDEHATRVDCTISDATGRIVHQQRMAASNGRVNIDASGIATGHYVVRIDDGSMTTTHRLVVN